jgi:hypothetical protein
MTHNKEIVDYNHSFNEIPLNINDVHLRQEANCVAIVAKR